MTRKQFFKILKIRDRDARNFFVDIVKKYNGKLSYTMLLGACYCIALCGISDEDKILECIDQFVEECDVTFSSKDLREILCNHFDIKS